MRDLLGRRNLNLILSLPPWLENLQYQAELDRMLALKVEYVRKPFHVYSLRSSPFRRLAPFSRPITSFSYFFGLDFVLSISRLAVPTQMEIFILKLRDEIKALQDELLFGDAEREAFTEFWDCESWCLTQA